jgi:hypothetical protein
VIAVTPRLKQRLGGCLIALLGAWGTAHVWHVALHEGLFFEKASGLFPAFFVMGVAAILFPGYKEERIARGEDISGMQGWKLLTPRWCAVLILSLTVGIGDYILLKMRVD